MQHFLSLFDITPDQLPRVLDTAAHLKSRLASGDRPPVLERYVVALLFEKPSLRTRVSFETGMVHLGGDSLFLGEDVGWKKRESPADFTRVLGEFVDAVVCRAKSHDRVEELAGFHALPVINGLTDLCHPCQALADAMTIRESLGTFAGKHLVFVGDGNNVSQSLALISAMLGMRFTLACPAGYDMDSAWLQQVAQQYPSAQIDTTHDPKAAVADADVVYTDVWASMGQESEKEERARIMAPYQVNANLMARAKPDARFMHCLPAYPGMEVTRDILDSNASIVWPQAENRLHMQKAILSALVS